MLARNIARIARKVLFSYIPARSWDFAETLQAIRSCKILQECKGRGQYLAILAIFLARAFLLRKNVLEIVCDNFSNTLLV